MAQEQPPLDPYRSPPLEAELVEDVSRPLTASERAVLELYFEHRGRPFSVLRLLPKMIPQWCVMLLGLGMIFGLLYWGMPGGSPLPGYFFMGMIGAIMGAILRDLGVARRLVQMWPMLREVFDWKRMGEILERGTLSTSSGTKMNTME